LRNKTKNGQSQENVAFASWLIAGVAGLLLLFHLFIKIKNENVKDGLDAVAVGLTAVGLSPWIAHILDTFKFRGMELKFVRQQIERQKHDIEALKFLLVNYVTKNELDHLNRLAAMDHFIAKAIWYPDILHSELRHLRGLGLIANHPRRSIHEMVSDKDEGAVHDYVYITDHGRRYLELRSAFTETEPPQKS
jgi:hypothetical protein